METLLLRKFIIRSYVFQFVFADGDTHFKEFLSAISFRYLSIVQVEKKYIHLLDIMHCSNNTVYFMQRPLKKSGALNFYRVILLKIVFF